MLLLLTIMLMVLALLLPPCLQSALAAYHSDVVGGAFPSQQFSPYRIPPTEVQQLTEALGREGMGRAAEAVERVAAEQEAHRQQQRQQGQQGAAAAERELAQAGS